MSYPDISPEQEEKKNQALTQMASFKDEIDSLNAAFAEQGIVASVAACTCPDVPDIVKTSRLLAENVFEVVDRALTLCMTSITTDPDESDITYDEDLLKRQCSSITAAFDEALRDPTVSSANALLAKLHPLASNLSYLQYGAMGRAVEAVGALSSYCLSPRTGYPLHDLGEEHSAREELMADRFERSLTGTPYAPFTVLSKHAYPFYLIRPQGERNGTTVTLGCSLDAQIDCPKGLRGTYFLDGSRSSFEQPHSGLDKDNILAAVYLQLHSIEGSEPDVLRPECSLHDSKGFQVVKERLPTYKVELTVSEVQPTTATGSEL